MPADSLPQQRKVGDPMRKALTFGTLAVLAIGTTAAWQYQHQVQEEQAGLLARAKVSQEAARATALASVRDGRITEAEIEEEDGRLIYSFDIAVGNDTYDVEVDAITGALLQSAIENDDGDDGDDDDDNDGR
jgi:uncharacterized membrane protein YkoI